MSAMYNRGYFEQRSTNVDRREWLDIKLGLRAGGARKSDRIVEVGAGTGELSRWLAARGWRVEPCDPYAPGVPRCALPHNIPPADVYILQHVLEHVEDIEASVETLSRAEVVVAILPGHLNDDATHHYNFFSFWDFDKIEGLFGSIRVYPIRRLVDLFARRGFRVAYAPDLWSFAAPWDLDWLLVATKRRRPRLARWLVYKAFKRIASAVV